MDILVLHGVNLNMFGKREHIHYGSWTLEDIDDRLQALAAELNLKIECRQTNAEYKMIEWLHELKNGIASGLLINAGAWTHYNYAIADALAMLEIPIVEVHMSNIFGREAFRHNSVISPQARGVICGFGLDSYLLGLRALANILAGSPD